MVIEKHAHDKVVDRWTGARYGPRQEFAEYAEQAGLRKGFLEAPLTVFPADGAHHNWDLQQARPVTYYGINNYKNRRGLPSPESPRCVCFIPVHRELLVDTVSNCGSRWHGGGDIYATCQFTILGGSHHRN